MVVFPSAEMKTGPEMLTATVSSVSRLVSSTMSWPVMIVAPEFSDELR
jgi:hypothetical protein